MLRAVRRLIVALLVLGAAVSGCGGGPSDAEQVQPTVEAFGRATRPRTTSGCATSCWPRSWSTEVERVGLPCEVALRQGLGEVKAPTLTIGRIEVRGDNATAEVRSAARASNRRADTLELVRVEDVLADRFVAG